MSHMYSMWISTFFVEFLYPLKSLEWKSSFKYFFTSLLAGKMFV